MTKERPKLIRDKISDLINDSGRDAITHIANGDEYWQMLKKKLLEEVNEFLDDENPEELADIQEVLYAICDYKNLNKNEIESIRKKKEIEKGSFKNRVILEEIKN